MDDLLDLNWSSTSSSSTSKPLTPSLQPSKPAPTSFDFLAKSNKSTASGTSSPNYYTTSTTTPRSSTPLNRSPALAQAPPQPIAKAAAPPTTSASSGDAFSSLLGRSGAGAGGSSKNLTMAQKQAQLADERRKKEEHEKQQFAGLGNWEQFSSGSASGSSSRTTPSMASIPSTRISSTPLQPIPTRSGAAFDGLLQPNPISRPSSSSSRSITPAPARTTAKSPLAWDDDDDFLAGASSRTKASTTSSKSSAQVPPADPWDFDQLAAVEPVKAQTQSHAQSRNGGTSGMRTPDPDFDFGEWKDMDDDRSTSRSGPSANGQRRHAERDEGHVNGNSRSRAPARPASPPPHIVGQIVEMGFSPAQARTALAKTTTGVDVQAALDGLLAQAFKPQSPDIDSGPEDLGEVDDDEYIERQRVRREEEERERRRKRRQGPSRDTIAPRSQEEQERSRSGTGTPVPMQADQILAQASEIGQSVLTKATSLWNTGKERAMKAYDEQKKVYEAQLAEAKKGQGQGQGKQRDGRPRWMVEAEAAGAGEERTGPSGSGGGFRDDDGEEVEEVDVRQRPRVNGNGPRREERRPLPPTQREKESAGGDLLSGSDAPASRTTTTQSRRPVEPASARASTPRAVTPTPPLPTRTLVHADSSAIHSSTTQKTKGNEHFKLGRFTEAESSYTSAITLLPEGNLYLIALYNNRAATRLKLGDSKGSAEDCTAVIGIIGSSYHPSKEAPLPVELGSEINLAESFVKAYTKRAQAWEMGEKWKNAVEDWEKILGFDVSLIGTGGAASKTQTLAAEGLRRSKQMIEGGSSILGSSTVAKASPTSTAKPKPKPPVPASKPAQVDRSRAVSTLRAAAKALEAEDQQRLMLKDTIEARINTWKGGKETNLRALLASLDTVLWDEVLAGGLKVGMHELITEKQVKIKYMKVIARLHPDKLDVNKTTVEQRMLANGAFGTLNEAWQAFNNA